MAHFGSGNRFPTTSWTMIARAEASRDDLGLVLERYWRPVYMHLRSAGRSPEDAADLTQAFFTERLIDRDLLKHADRMRGRFRNFLLEALRNFAIDEHRRERGRRDERPHMIPAADLESVESVFREIGEAGPDEAYHREWARSLLSRACVTVRDACMNDGMQRQWEIYEARILHPAEHGCAPVSASALVERFNLRDRSELDSMVLTIRRKLLRQLHSLVADTVASDADVEAELAELRDHLQPR